MHGYEAPEIQKFSDRLAVFSRKRDDETVRIQRDGRDPRVRTHSTVGTSDRWTPRVAYCVTPTRSGVCSQGQSKTRQDERETRLSYTGGYRAGTTAVGCCVFLHENPQWQLLKWTRIRRLPRFSTFNKIKLQLKTDVLTLTHF